MAIPYKIVGLNFHILSQNKDFKNTHCICELCKKNLTDDAEVVVGKCHHAFHTACMFGKISCPIDDIVWTTDYTVTNVNTLKK